MDSLQVTVVLHIQDYTYVHPPSTSNTWLTYKKSIRHDHNFDVLVRL